MQLKEQSKLPPFVEANSIVFVQSTQLVGEEIT